MLIRLYQTATAALFFISLAMFMSPGLTAALPTQEQSADNWRYTLEQPAEGWQNADFDDSDWKSGAGGFGNRQAPSSPVQTNWNTSDIWLRKTFDIVPLPDKPALMIYHDEDVEVFINGQQVLSLPGYTNQYIVKSIPAEQSKTLKQGQNLIAVHCKQTTGGQFIDVHFCDADNPPERPSTPLFKSDLITQWGESVTAENAWREYPRPQLMRTEWINLNGNWDYAVTANDVTSTPEKWDGKILVPFCLESKLGGVQKRLKANQSLWVQRAFNATPIAGRRMILNFEAVDYRSEVFVNGTSVGQHVGGNTPFSFDISDSIKVGENQLMVRVEDETEGWQLRGKQVINAEGIWYTQVSGIWQTVWMESVPNSYLADLKILTDASTGEIRILPEIENRDAVSSVRVVVKDEGQFVTEATGGSDEISLKIENAKPWSPQSPHLYDLEITLLDSGGNVVDQVISYTGIRTVGKARDADGHLRMTLNGKSIFHWGPLDQGWWPDGLLTPPSDEAMLFDIQWLKDAGFNMIRKHIKVEPRRYYYHCDRVGMMVWQDQVSAGKGPQWTFLEPDPKDADWPDEHHQQFMLEFERMVDDLENHPSIVLWGPFNEAWGQHNTMDVGKWIVERDPSRLVNIASGGNFWPIGDVVDKHEYPNPAFPFDADRFKDFIKVVGEFGGHGFPIEGHLWDSERDNWGYGGLPKTKEEYRDRYKKSLEMLIELKQKGVSAGVYTQTTDVEGEINGLMTYDRKVIKIPADELAKMHQPLLESDNSDE